MESAAPVDVFKKSVTGAAYAAGGALGGLVLGAVGGEVMSRLTQNEIFSTLGGGVGAASVPFVAAATLGLVGLQSEVNKDWASGYSYKPSAPVLDTVARSGFGAAGASALVGVTWLDTA